LAPVNILGKTGKPGKAPRFLLRLMGPETGFCARAAAVPWKTPDPGIGCGVLCQQDVVGMRKQA